MDIHEPIHPTTHKKTPCALMDKHETRHHTCMDIRGPGPPTPGATDIHTRMKIPSCLSMGAGVFLRVGCRVMDIHGGV